MHCAVVGAHSTSFTPFRFTSLSKLNEIEFWHFPHAPHTLPTGTEVVVVLFGESNFVESLSHLHSHSLAIRNSGFQGQLLYYSVATEGSESFISLAPNSDQQLEFFQQALRLIALKFQASIYTGGNQDELLQIVRALCTGVNNQPVGRTVAVHDLLIWAGWDSKTRIGWINEAFGAEELAGQQQEDEIFLECILAKFSPKENALQSGAKNVEQNWLARFSAQLEATGGGEESTAFSFASTPKVSLSAKAQQAPIVVNSTQKEAISNFFASLMHKTSASKGRSGRN